LPVPVRRAAESVVALPAYREEALATAPAIAQRIAIVDDTPQQQYLYPESLLFRRLFERHGLQAVIADPSQLSWRDGALHHEQGVIDAYDGEVQWVAAGCTKAGRPTSARRAAGLRRSTTCRAAVA
jgi:hypothetical protein